ncbi:hypothetical protein B0H66DRAFT_614580, partial [Apodospora peruviana]
RGWTYQEDLFSRRKLIFQADCVCWGCWLTHLYEEDRQLPRVSKLNQLQIPNYRHVCHCETGHVSRAIPDIAGLVDLLRYYNQRRFTFSEDALNSFGGIATALRPCFLVPFIAGLPACFLDIALL